MKRALLIGVDYKDQAYRVYAETLYTKLQYEEKILLTNDATKSTILNELHNIIINSKHSDVILFYFSGHYETAYKSYLVVADGVLHTSEIMNVLLNTTKRITIQIIFDSANTELIYNLPYHIHKNGHIETGFDCKKNILLVQNILEAGQLTRALMNVLTPTVDARTLPCNIATTYLENKLVYI